MPLSRTKRGFAKYAEFEDTFGATVTVRQSSAATRDAVWVSVDGGSTSTNKGATHLNKQQAVELVRVLQEWIATATDDETRIAAMSPIVNDAGPPEAPHPPAQHTPGPWRLDDSAESTEVLTQDGICIAQAIDPYLHKRPMLPATEVQANRRLIAAAPELLEATRSLYRLLREWRRTPFFDNPHEWQRWADDLASRVDDTSTKAESAIGKATGRQP